MMLASLLGWLHGWLHGAAPAAAVVGAVALTLLAWDGLRRARIHRRAWRVSEELRYSIVESIPEPFFIVDRDLRLTHVNERAEQLLRLTAVDLIGKRIHHILDPFASELVPEIRNVLASGNDVCPQM